VLLGAASLAARSQPLDRDRRSWIEAGFVLNFLRFTEWPPRPADFPGSPLRVTVVGAPALAADLQRLVRGEYVGPHRRPIEVREAVPARPGVEEEARVLLEQLTASHLLFIGRADAHRIDWLLDQVENHAVLTVSDAPDFVDQGGMLGLVVRGGRMSFEAAPKRIAGAGITVSSKVLRLAHIVEARDP
jgi:hypothetical protein